MVSLAAAHKFFRFYLDSTSIHFHPSNVLVRGLLTGWTNLVQGATCTRDWRGLSTKEGVLKNSLS